MDKTFFRYIVLTLIISIISWHSPAFGRVRSGEEGSTKGGEIGTHKVMVGKLDGSNKSIVFPSSKSKKSCSDTLTSEYSNTDASPDPSILTERHNLEDNDISYFQQMGIASWYGREFDGRITASGELCNTRDMVASHKTLPFGTLVEVINNLTGQSVTVRINDRGPFVNGRIINLSRSAAEEIDLIEKGVVEVSIRTITHDN